MWSLEAFFPIPLNMVLLYAVSNHNILLGTGTRKENNLLALHDIVETTTTTVFPEFGSSEKKLSSPQCYSLFSCLFFFMQNLFSLYAMPQIFVLSSLMNLNLSSLPNFFFVFLFFREAYQKTVTEEQSSGL